MIWRPWRMLPPPNHNVRGARRLLIYRQQLAVYVCVGMHSFKLIWKVNSPQKWNLKKECIHVIIFIHKLWRWDEEWSVPSGAANITRPSSLAQTASPRWRLFSQKLGCNFPLHVVNGAHLYRAVIPKGFHGAMLLCSNHEPTCSLVSLRRQIV